MKKKNIRLLLIEDNPGDIRRVKAALTEVKSFSFELFVEADLASGLGSLAAQPLDAILLDLNLLDSPGLDTFSKVYAKAPGVPIILLTGVEDDAQAVKAVRAGAQDYLVKNRLSAEVLVRSIRNAIQRKQAEEPLRENEARYRAIFEGVEDAIFVETPAGLILDVNQRACEMYGYTRAQLLSMEVIDLVPSKEFIFIFGPDNPAPPPEHPVETINVRANGERFPIELSLRVQERKDEPVLFVVVRDITERKQAEQALLVRTSDLNERVKELRCLYGISKLIAESGKSLDAIFAEAVRLIPSGWSYPEKTSARIVFKDQQFITDNLRETHWNLSADLLVSGKKLGAVEVFYMAEEPTSAEDPFLKEERDLIDDLARNLGIMVESRQAEDALKRAEQKYRSIFENATEGIHQTTPDGNILNVNPAGVRMLGFDSPEDLITSLNLRDTRFYVQPGRRAEFLKMMEADGTVSGFESEVYRKDGSTAWISENTHSVFDEQGNLLYYEGTSVDITKRKQAENALQESELLLRALFELSPDSILLIDPNAPDDSWPIIDCNLAACRINGYERDELIGNSIDMLNAFPAVPDERNAYRKRMQAQDSLHLEAFHRHKNGTVFPVEISTRLIQVGSRELVIGIDRDITGRKRVEKALLESEDRFREIFENMGNGVVVYEALDDGTDFKINNFNRAAEKIENIARETVIGKTVYEAFPGVKEFGLFDALQRVWKNGQPENLPITFYTDARMSGWRENYIARLPSGEILVVYDDVTERKQAEQALRASEELFRSFIEQSSEGVVLIDEQGLIIEWNRAQEQITGIPSQQAIGAPFWEIQYQLLPPERRADRPPEFLKNTMQAAFRNGQIPTSGRLAEITINSKGEAKSIFQASFPIKTATGYRIGSVVRDITERKRAEMELQASHTAEQDFSERLATLSVITTELSNADSLDALCRRAVELGRERLDFDRFSIWFLAKDRLTMLGTYGTDVEGRTSDERTEQFIIGPDFPDSQVFNGQIPLLRRTDSPLALKGQNVGQGTHVAAGLWDGKEVIGYISVDNLLRQRPIRDRDCEIIRLYASAVGHLISLKRSGMELQASHAAEKDFSERLSVLSEVTTELSKTGGLDKTLRRAVELGHEQLGFDRIAILFINEDHTAMRGSFGVDGEGRITDERKDHFQIGPDSPIWSLVKGDVPLVHIPDKPLYLNSQVVGQGDLVFAGLWDGNAVIGYISVDNLLHQRPFSDHDYEIINLYASALGQLISLKRAEGTLQMSEARFRSIFENTAIGFYQTTPDGQILLANPAILHMLGYPTFEALSHRNLEEQEYQIGLPRSEFRQRIEKDGEIKDLETAWVRADKTTLHVRENARLVYDESGKVLYYEGTAEDITERKRAEATLRTSEEKFRKAFMISPDAININRLQDGMFIAINQGFTQIMGYTEAESLGKTSLELNIWANPDDRKTLVDDLLKNGVVTNLEARFYARNGDLKYGLMSASLLELNSVPHIISITRDITERKRTEAALIKTERIYRQAITGTGGVPYQVDYASNQYVFLGEGIQTLTGYTPAEMSGSAFFAGRIRQVEAYGENKELTHAERVQLSRQDGSLQEWREDYLFERKDGILVWLSDHSVPVLDNNGSPVGSLGILMDITERKQVEQTLRESEERFRFIFENANDAIFIENGNDEILSANRRAGEMLGYSLAEFTKMHVADIQAPEVRRPVSVTKTQVLEHRNSIFEGLDLHRSGRRIPVEISVGQIEQASAELYVSIVRDITERRQAEQALRDSEQHFHSLFENMIEGVALHELTFDESHLPVNYQLVDCNSQYEQIIGLKRKKVIGHLATEVYQLPEAPYLKEYSLVAESGNSTRFETFFAPMDKYFSISVAPWGKQGFATIFSDVTARIQAEKEMARRDEELRLRNQELDRLYRASGSLLLSASASPQELAQTIVGIIQQEFGQANCSLLLVQRESNELQRLAAAGPYTDQVKKKTLTLDGPGLVPQAIRTGQTVNVGNVQTVPNYLPNWESAMSEMAVPLKIGSDVIGVIDTQSAELDAFNMQDESLMTIFAERAALAIEHSRLYEQTESRVQQLAALRTVDMAISSSFDIHLTLDILLDQVRAQLGVHAADILAYNQITQTFSYSCGQGFRTHALQHTRLRLGEGYAGRAAMERRLIKVPDLHAEPSGFGKSPLLVGENFVSYAGVPLVAKGQIKGVLEIFHREPFDLTADQQAFLEILGGQAGIAMDNAELYEHQQRSIADLTIAYNDTLEGWASALELRDKETEGHTRRVTDLTMRLTRALGVNENDQVQIYRGALLHDIGKIGVPDAIVLKPGPLTDAEWVIMRQHPLYAYNMLSPIGYLHDALNVPYCHHEKWDGTGYPRGLKAEEIPLAARIFSVVDVWDALTSDRPYRKAWTHEKARLYISEQSGTQFEPKVVETFLREVLPQ